MKTLKTMYSSTWPALCYNMHFSLSLTAKKNRTDDPRSISCPVNREAGHYVTGSVVLKVNPEKSPLYSYKCNHLCYFYLINGAKVIKAINWCHIIQLITCERDVQ